MDFEAVKLWLTNYTAKEIRRHRLLAMLGFVLLPLATLIGGALIYGPLFLLAHQTDKNPDITVLDPNVLLTTLGILAGMFIVNAFIRKKKEPEKFYYEDPEDADDSLLGEHLHRRKIVADFFLWIIFTGPRLLSWSISSLKEISRLKKQDTHSCAGLLWLMLMKHAKVPYDSISKELDWVDVEKTLSEIQHLPGIVFLKNPPPGISMTDDLRTAIRNGTPL